MVVEKGVLKMLLTTRQPVRGVSVTTGRARLPGMFGARQPRISNLFVKAPASETMEGLKTKLIDMVKQQGKPYGILVRKMDFPSFGSIDDLRRLSQRTAGSGGGRPVSNPVLVYQVMPDGSEKLVRGLRFRNLNTRAFRDIMAASKETAVFSYIDNGLPLALTGAGNNVVGCSVAAPGVLFEDLELEPASDDAPKLPVVAPPPAE
jgi:TldD protein